MDAKVLPALSGLNPVVRERNFTSPAMSQRRLVVPSFSFRTRMDALVIGRRRRNSEERACTTVHAKVIREEAKGATMD